MAPAPAPVPAPAPAGAAALAESSEEQRLRKELRKAEKKLRDAQELSGRAAGELDAAQREKAGTVGALAQAVQILKSRIEAEVEKNLNGKI